MNGVPRRLEEHEEVFAIKTWRYLRMAMIVLVLGLGTSLVYEVIQVGADCVQGSISAYYYTPVRGYFVGALLAIGTCLYCLKGNTEPEDFLLNLAGMAAPFVALVPTGAPGTSCSSSEPGTDVRVPNVDNNVHALIAVGLAAFVAIAVLWALEKDKRMKAPRGAVVGYLVAAELWLAAIAFFVVDRAAFRSGGHMVAAAGMFGCITAVVAINGWSVWRGGGRRLNRYTVIAAAMIVSAAVCGVLAWKTDWGYAVLVLELALISLFAVFWTLQTVELWTKGLRPRTSPDQASAGPG